MNHVNQRIGRKTRDFTARAQRKRVMATVERLKLECPPHDWKRKLAESMERDGVIDIDDCREVYGNAAK